MDSMDSETNEKESGSSKKEVDVVQECMANDCTLAADGAASDGVLEKEGTVLSGRLEYVIRLTKHEGLLLH